MSTRERNPMSITLRGVLSVRWALLALVVFGQGLLSSLASPEALAADSLELSTACLCAGSALMKHLAQGWRRSRK